MLPRKRKLSLKKGHIASLEEESLCSYGDMTMPINEEIPWLLVPLALLVSGVAAVKDKISGGKVDEYSGTVSDSISADFKGVPNLAKPVDGIVSIDKNGRVFIQRGSSKLGVPKEIAHKIPILNSEGKPKGSFKAAFLQLADGTKVIAGYDYEKLVPVIELQKGLETFKLQADSKLDLELMTLTKDYGISSIQVSQLDIEDQTALKESLQLFKRPEAKSLLNELGFESVEALQRFCSSAGQAELENKLKDFQQIYEMKARAKQRGGLGSGALTRGNASTSSPLPPKKPPKKKFHEGNSKIGTILFLIGAGTVLLAVSKIVQGIMLPPSAYEIKQKREKDKKELERKAQDASEENERELKQLEEKAKAEREQEIAKQKEIAKPASDERIQRSNFVEFIRIPTMRYIEALRQNKLINSETTESSATNKRWQKNPADKAKFDERQQKLRDESDRFLEEAKTFLKENLKKEDPKKKKVGWNDNEVESYVAFLNNKNVASPEGIPREIINGIEKVLLAGKSVYDLEGMEKDLSAGVPAFAYAEVDKFKQAYPHNFSLFKSQLSWISDADLETIRASVKAAPGKKDQKTKDEIKLEQIQTWILVASGYHHVISSVESQKDFPAAVAKFQGEHNLKPDGIVGDKTMEMLIKVKNYITTS